ncbi:MULTISPECIES: flagellar basal body-associated protein FliL [unclassified Methylobacterium]|jgi:flagellar FliL protein|uniref:flagellar basal body-associated protein FliL n=1 Tax=unclassified Methylobacterium TaxID=2615210 RepID=UPI001352AF5B|nr:flagellar basal body-associated protein FliL [Methylobacterium sp. 2A]MWV25979.1 flagellar basal body-associated protein FliL [Methylobacterium sp. 2A]
MAKKPKKASAEEGEAGADSAPKGKKKLMIIVAVAVLALAGGGGAFLLMGRGGHGDGAEASAGGHGGGHGGAHGDAATGPDGKRPVVFVDVREMLLNLSPDLPQDKTKYAKVRLALELKDAKVEEEVKPLMPRVEDALQVYMRELRPSDLTSSLGLFRLREELLRRVNIALYPVRVEAVLFKDVIVQ